jgi:hypothetical protein
MAAHHHHFMMPFGAAGGRTTIPLTEPAATRNDFVYKYHKMSIFKKSFRLATIPDRLGATQ